MILYCKRICIRLFNDTSYLKESADDLNISTLGKILHVNILKTYKRRVIIKKVR